MITQTLEQAGRLTHDHNPTYTLALLGNFQTTPTKTGTRHIFIRSLTHITLTDTHAHTHTHVLANQTRQGS